MLRRRYLVVGLLGVVSAITFLDRMAIAVVGPLVQRDLDLTPEKWSWVLSAYVIAYGLFKSSFRGAGGSERSAAGADPDCCLVVRVYCADGVVHEFSATICCALSVWDGGGGGLSQCHRGVAGVGCRRGERGAKAGRWCGGYAGLGGTLVPLIPVPRGMFGLLVGASSFGGWLPWGILWAVVCGWLWYHDRPSEQPGITASELVEIGGKHAGRSAPVAAVASLAAAAAALAARGGLWVLRLGKLVPSTTGFRLGWCQRRVFRRRRRWGFMRRLPFLLGMVSNFVGGYLCDRLGVRFGIRVAYRAITFACLGITSVLLLGMSFATGHVAVIILATASFATMDLMLPAAWAMCMSIGGAAGGDSASSVMRHVRSAWGSCCAALAFGYIVKGTGDYNIPVRVVAVMVLISALVFSRIDCTRGLTAETEGVGAVGAATKSA